MTQEYFLILIFQFSNRYWKEPNYYKKERVLRFLYYINNFESKNGGNLKIYEYKNKPETYLREPDPEKFEYD